MIYDENEGLIIAATGAFQSPVETDVEYESPNQLSGIYGRIYRQFFTTSLPSDLTSGDNVSKVIAHEIIVTDDVNRYVFRGWADRGSGAAGVYLTGASGNGNLTISSAVFTLVSGWVDYTK